MELQELLPPDVRKKAYLVYALLGAVLTATGVGIAAAGILAAVWLAVAVAVYGSLGTAFGFVAGSNVPKPSAPSGQVPAGIESYAPRRDAGEDVPDSDYEPVNPDESLADSDELS